MDIQSLVQSQRTFFNQGATIELSYRKEALDKLYKAILKYEQEIYAAMYADLGKSEMESGMCEVRLTLSELSFVRKRLSKWAKRKLVFTDLSNFHGKSFAVKEPYGVVLIMAPWNYPFLLCLEPLIGAIAAGNCCIIKPSAYAPAVSKILGKIIQETFDSNYIALVQGGREENNILLDQRFDYIFFTGSVAVGKLVMEKAAKNLTPVSLELGGKSPCIIEKSANLKIAAKRIAFGKYLNCGQTCVAPDYLLIEESIKSEFVPIFIDTVKQMYGENPLENTSYGNIVNEKHFERIMGLIDSDKVILGGTCNKESLQIAPTIMDGVVAGDDVMGEEIFGPILPILTFQNIKEAEQFIREREKPLALYLFTSNKKVEQYFIKHVSFGGGCINDTIMHLATSRLGFGGVGHSGMGAYHGKKSFDTFSHEKSIVKKYTWLDVPIRYQPYTTFKEKIMRLLLH